MCHNIVVDIEAIKAYEEAEFDTFSKVGYYVKPGLFYADCIGEGVSKGVINIASHYKQWYITFHIKDKYPL